MGSLLFRVGSNLAPAAKPRKCQTEMPAAWWGQGTPSAFPSVRAQGHNPCPILEVSGET